MLCYILNVSCKQNILPYHDHNRLLIRYTYRKCFILFYYKIISSNMTFVCLVISCRPVFQKYLSDRHEIFTSEIMKTPVLLLSKFPLKILINKTRAVLGILVALNSTISRYIVPKFQNSRRQVMSEKVFLITHHR